MKDNKISEKQGKRKKLILKVINGILIGIIVAITGVTIFGMINQNCKNASAETIQAREGDNRQWEEYPEQWTQILPYLKTGENYNKVDPEETFLKSGTYDLDTPIIFYLDYTFQGESRKEVIIANQYETDSPHENTNWWTEVIFRKEGEKKHIKLVFSSLQELTDINITPYTGDYEGDEEGLENGKCYIVSMETDSASETESEKLKKILWEISYTSVYEVWYDKGVEVSYETGYNDGYNKGYSEASRTTFNPIGMIITPVATFFNTPMFGEFSIGSFFVVALFVAIAIIFLKIFAGG